MIELSNMFTPAAELRESMMAIIDILNNTERVEVASPFWVSTMKVLKKDAKFIQYAGGSTVPVDDQTS